MTFNFSSDEHAFRDATERQQSCHGVTGPSFVCRGCGKPRRTSGRKKTAEGWRCAGCWQAVEYRKAVGGAQ